VPYRHTSPPAHRYAHHLPAWLHAASVVVVYYIEIALPFLFLVPVASLRVFAGAVTAVLMATIALTGNYNFFNLLTMVLCIPLLDDGWLAGRFLQRYAEVPAKEEATTSRPAVRFLARLLVLVVVGGLLYSTGPLFDLRLDTSGAGMSEWHISAKVAFTEAEFSAFLPRAMMLGVTMAAANLVVICAVALLDAVQA